MIRRLALALTLLAAAPAAAHHSLAAYDSGRPLTLTGEVTEFSFSNPHPYLVVAVKPPSGPVQQWRMEMDNLWELQGVGMTRDTFRPKDRLKVTGSPDRDGGHALYVRQLDRADGLFYEQVGMSPRLRLPNPK
jgi:hypothetical protein